MSKYPKILTACSRGWEIPELVLIVLINEMITLPIRSLVVARKRSFQLGEGFLVFPTCGE